MAKVTKHAKTRSQQRGASANALRLARDWFDIATPAGSGRWWVRVSCDAAENLHLSGISKAQAERASNLLLLLGDDHDVITVLSGGSHRRLRRSFRHRARWSRV